VRTRDAIIAIAVISVAAVVVSGLFIDARFRKWNERVERVQEFAKAETARADSAVAEADAEEARADSIAEEASSRAPIIRERIVIIREEPIPEECEDFVIPRDSIIDELLVESEQWETAYEAETRAVGKLRFAYTRLGVVNDSLSTVLDDRPRPRPAWMPSLEVGIFAGICTNGRPCIGAGVGLSFKVRIPFP